MSELHDRIRVLVAALEGGEGVTPAEARAALAALADDPDVGALASAISRRLGDAQRDRLAAAGALAGSLAGGLATPLARVRDALGQTCDLLDRHVAHSKGPDPLPRHQVSRIRELVADAYMDVSRSARLAADLAAVVAPSPAPSHDVNDVVERAVALAGHRLSQDFDLRLDLGSLPPIACDGARLAQSLAHLLLDAADALAPANGALSVSTREDGDDVVIELTHDVVGTAASSFAALARADITAQGGRFVIERTVDGTRVAIRFTSVRIAIA
jgi:signal transduction histidine kinase